MATATAKTLRAQLDDLQQRADQLHGKAREARDAKTRYELEAHDLRARIDQLDPRSDEYTQTRDAILEREASRIHNTGHHAERYQAAVKPFHAADLELQRFKRRHLAALVEEIVADNLGDGAAELDAAFSAIVEFCGRYHQTREQVEALVTSVTGMDWKDIAWCPAIDTWRAFASDALDIDVDLPRLSETGRWKAANQTDDLPTDKDQTR